MQHVQRARRRVAALVSATAVAAFGTVVAAPAVSASPTELFFSEYIEGSSNNKALEIYNGTGAAVDLAAGEYNVQMFFNGSATAGTTVNLTGSVASGDVFVLAQSAAVTAILDAADQLNGSSWFNGDDAVVLRKDTTVLDVIGQVGFDPGSQWGADLTSTADNTLRRLGSICAGDPDGSDPFDPALEWVGFAQDTFDGLGAHIANCNDPEPISPVINEFSASTTGTDVEYLEVLGEPNSDLSNYRLLEIEGDSGSPQGTIDEVVELGTADADGRYLKDLAANALENGTITLLLVEGFTGALGDDLDTNDDGTLDVTPWAAVADAVAVNDGDAGDLTYGVPVLGVAYDGLAYAPGGASRIPDGTDTDTAADWMRNDFDLFGIPGYAGTPVLGEAVNTPGTVNVAYEPPVGDAAPEVTSTVPANGATDVALDADLTVTFSEPVDVTGAWFTLSCTTSGTVPATVTGGPTTWTINPDADLALGETCTLTIVAEQVSDQDTDDGPDTMVADHVVTFETQAVDVCEAEYTPIFDIQGDGATAAITGPVTTKGVVVGDFQSGGFNGYFLQDASGDGDTATSDGIFIYAPGGIDVAEGDVVHVAGSAGEYQGMTQVSASAVVICDTGGALPPATEVMLPMAPDEYEPLEGMLVTLPQSLAILEYYNFDRFGEIRLGTDRQYQPTAVYEPGSDEAIDLAEANALNAITLDDGRSSQNPDPAIHPNGEEFTLDNTFRGGDLVANATGVLDYRFSLWRVQPTEGADHTAVNPRPAVPEVG
ncbi:MAG: Ig-like domain-containing protein, partial [Actinomycetota bacterium]